MQTDWGILKLASEVIQAHEIRQPPVDPLSIAAREKIRIGEIDHPAFEGRIEYSEGVFLLYHPPLAIALYPYRIRFGIAHELGHFYIESHRERLLSGKFWTHRSRPGRFNSSDRIENEADQFAAALLMPDTMLARTFGRAEPSIERILSLAGSFRVSAQVAAIRIVQESDHPCVTVVSEGEHICYYVSSPGAEEAGFGGLGISTVPPDVITRAAKQGGGIVGRTSSTGVWFSERHRYAELWEEAVALGETGKIMTLLSLDVKVDL